jgi:hypothetical protein
MMLCDIEEVSADKYYFLVLVFCMWKYVWKIFQIHLHLASTNTYVIRSISKLHISYVLSLCFLKTGFALLYTVTTWKKMCNNK